MAASLSTPGQLSPSLGAGAGADMFSAAGPSSTPSSPSSLSYAPYRSPRRGMAPSDSLVSWDSASSLSQAPSPYFGKQHDAKRDELAAVLEAIQACKPADLQTKLHLGSQIHRLLIEGKSAKDDFRDAGGFLVVVQMLSSLDESAASAPLEGVQEQQQQDKLTVDGEGTTMHERLRIEIFRLALTILAEALGAGLHPHAANRRAFESLVGWDQLGAVLRLSTIMDTSRDHFFSALFGLALADVSSHLGRLRALRLDLDARQKQLQEQEQEQEQGPEMESKDGLSEDQETAYMAKKVAEQWSGSHIEHAGVFRPVLLLANEMRESDRRLFRALHLIIEKLATTSKANQVALADAKIGSLLFKHFADDREGSESSKDEVLEKCQLRIVQRIYQLGIPAQDCRLMLRQLCAQETGGPLMDMLLAVAGPSAAPNMATFDMGRLGHSSLAVSSLRRAFPPSSSSHGFSFFAPILIDRIEPSLPLDLLHIFDAQRACSVKIQIEPGTGQVTYTSREQKQPVRFQASRIVAGRLHHLCLVHIRPTGAQRASAVQLFIDGSFVEEQQAHWPVTPPIGAPVRAVFGTPPISSNGHGKAEDRHTHNNRLTWSLGPAYLLDDVLPPEMPLVLSELSFSGYHGNLQDSLGRFLTYPISTRINLRLDTLARTHGITDKELASHPLVTAIAGSARTLFAEDKFYFVLNVANSWGSDRIARRTMTRPAAGSDLILNQAVTLTRDAVEASYGYAKVFGAPTLSTPHSLADTVWELGGSAVILKLVEAANETESLDKAVRLLFKLVQDSWRCSEEIERARGYEVLDYLLHQKRHLISEDTLTTLFEAVGIETGREATAALFNPFLYRIILLDFSIWAATPPNVQQAHLDHFNVLLRTSKHRRFNAKRMAKMQIPRKLLYALRSGQYSQEMVPRLVTALRTSLTSSFNDMAIRNVSTYLASMLCRASDQARDVREPPRRQQTISGDVELLQGSQGSPVESTPPQTEAIDAQMQVETALKVFEMLADLVLEKPAFLLKLGSAVNIKWLLVFFGPTAETKAAILSLEIMSALLLSDARYADRLARSGGVKVAERLLPRFWASPAVFARCWATLLGQQRQQNTSVLANFPPSPTTKIVCPIMMRLIAACLIESLEAVQARDAKSTSIKLKPRPSDTLGVPQQTQRRHGRKRSQSMNVDVKELAQTFQANSELTLVKETIELIEDHANSSLLFRELLFSPTILRSLIAAITPFVTRPKKATNVGSLEPSNDGSVVQDLSDKLLTILSRSTVESIISSGSTRAVTALLDSVPPYTDLSTSTNFRSALYDKVVRSILVRLQHPDTAAQVLQDEVACRALADFLEQCSGDEQNTTTLSLTALLLEALYPLRDHLPNVVHSLLTTLDRIILFQLTDTAARPELFEHICAHHAIVFLDENRDLAFFRCLLYNLLDEVHGGKPTSRAIILQTLKLMAQTKAEMVEAVIVPEKNLEDLLQSNSDDLPLLVMGGAEDEVTPFMAEWQGFTKSTDNLKAAIHLDRLSQIKQLLDRSDERQRVLVTTESRMKAWQATVRASDETKYVKFHLDAAELDNFAAGEWSKLKRELERERGLLGLDDEVDRIFELDYSTEGPMRMRAKLREATMGEEREQEKLRRLPDAADPDPNKAGHGDDWGSGEGVMADEPSPVDARAASASPTDDRSGSRVDIEPSSASLQNDSHDDKFRRVLRSLEKGDIIEGVENSLRVVFIDCRASLLVFGKKCLYIIDDYFQRPDGELCNLWEAPEEERDTVVMSTLSGDPRAPSSLVAQLEGGAQQTRKWKWSQLKLVTLKTFLHRKTALELFFKDGQSCLLVLATTTIANRVFNDLAVRNKTAVQSFDALRDGLREAPASSSGQGSSGFSRFAGAVLGRGAGSLTQQWQEGKICNFDYLMLLNTAAGRTYLDVTQYPVMPWVLRDYTSETLDLKDPKSFRDLSLPMGAQSSDRRRQFEERYAQLEELQSMDPEANKPFHYGTHYSTAATVSGYLIRMRPFDKVLKALQGGTFDLADRTFSSIGQAYSSASEGSLGDVRELIPEAYYLPEFLTNSNKFEFGTTQSGMTVDDVVLPPWAKGDARLFIKLHRQALESDYVSAHLHEWIDLIFGHKQRGTEAINATNCFHELSYDDALDLQGIDSAVERQAVLKTIHMFGVCPKRLFVNPHPARHVAVQQTQQSQLQSQQQSTSLSERPWLFLQGIVPIRSLKGLAVHHVYFSESESHPQRSFASPRDYLILPKLGLSISVGHLDGSIRVFGKDPNRAASVTEQVMPGRVSCLAQADDEGRVLVGSLDGLVTAWQLDAAQRSLTFLHASRGHRGKVLCLAYSHVWSLALSGSADGTAIVWDNGGNYVASLLHDGQPVQHVAIAEDSGMLATTSGNVVRVWSINGKLISQASSSSGNASGGSASVHSLGQITALSFYRPKRGKETLPDAKLCMLLTGHQRGQVALWRCSPRHGNATSRAKGDDSDKSNKHSIDWVLEIFHVFQIVDRFARTSSRDEDSQQQGRTAEKDALGLFLPTTSNASLLGADKAQVLSSSVSAVHATSEALLVGDESGRLVLLSPFVPGTGNGSSAPDYSTALSAALDHQQQQYHSTNGQATSGSSAAMGPGGTNSCLDCWRKMGVFEKKATCQGCGGTFCSACCGRYVREGGEMVAGRMCAFCKAVLERALSRETS